MSKNTQFICENCDKCFNRKANYERHLKRKFPCKKNPVKSIEGFDNPKKDLDCEHCLKTYSSVSNLNKHLITCKIKKDKDMKDELFNLLIKQQSNGNAELVEQNNLLKQQIELLQTKLSTAISIKTQNNTQNNIVQNTTNNIKILAYDKTDSSHITRRDWYKIIRTCSKSVINLVEKLHYDPMKPENMNIYNSNIKNNYLMKWNGIEWDIVGEEETLENIVENSNDLMDLKICEWKLENHKYFESASERFNKYLNSQYYDEHNEETKKKIKILMYNKRLKKNII